MSVSSKNVDKYDKKNKVTDGLNYFTVNKRPLRYPHSTHGYFDAYTLLPYPYRLTTRPLLMYREVTPVATSEINKDDHNDDQSLNENDVNNSNVEHSLHRSPKYHCKYVFAPVNAEGLIKVLPGVNYILKLISEEKEEKEEDFELKINSDEIDYDEKALKIEKTKCEIKKNNDKDKSADRAILSDNENINDKNNNTNSYFEESQVNNNSIKTNNSKKISIEILSDSIVENNIKENFIKDNEKKRKKQNEDTKDAGDGNKVKKARSERQTNNSSKKKNNNDLVQEETFIKKINDTDDNKQPGGSEDFTEEDNNDNDTYNENDSSENCLNGSDI